MGYKIDTMMLRSEMALAGINSIGELCERAGIARSTASAILNGRGSPTLSVVYKISRALGLSPEQTTKIFIGQA